MWRLIAVFLLGGVLGTAFGVGVGFFAFPYVFPPPPAMEELRAGDSATRDLEPWARVRVRMPSAMWTTRSTSLRRNRNPSE